MVLTDELERVEPTDDGVRVVLSGRDPIDLRGLFVHPVWRQAAPFAEQLGLETGDLGGIRLDSQGETSRPGVYAAGDLAHHRDLPMPVASVLTAAAAGLVAAASCDADLL
jgi:thioredoxin reductase